MNVKVPNLLSYGVLPNAVTARRCKRSSAAICDSATVRFGACDPLGTEEKGSFSETCPQQFALHGASARLPCSLRYT